MGLSGTIILAIKVMQNHVRLKWVKWANQYCNDELVSAKKATGGSWIGTLDTLGVTKYNTIQIVTL